MSDQMHQLPWHLSVYRFQEDGPVEFWLQDVAHLKVAQFETRTDAEFVLAVVNRRTSHVIYDQRFKGSEITAVMVSRDKPSYVPPPVDPELYDWPKGQPKPLPAQPNQGNR